MNLAYKSGVIFKSKCGGDFIIIEGKYSHRYSMHFKLSPYAEILSVASGSFFEGAYNALSELEEDLKAYESGRMVVYPPCDRVLEEKFQEERKRIAEQIVDQLSDRPAWKAHNDAIRLAIAQIKSWLRIVLYDAVENLPVVEDLLNDTIQSPDDLLEKGESLWEVVDITQEQIEKYSNALKDPGIVEQLRNDAYGHAGIMRTQYLGIDPVPAALRLAGQ